jgi:hypothetical protein
MNKTHAAALAAYTFQTHTHTHCIPKTYLTYGSWLLGGMIGRIDLRIRQVVPIVYVVLPFQYGPNRNYPNAKITKNSTNLLS